MEPQAAIIGRAVDNTSVDGASVSHLCEGGIGRQPLDLVKGGFGVGHGEREASTGGNGPPLGTMWLPPSHTTSREPPREENSSFGWGGESPLDHKKLDLPTYQLVHAPPEASPASDAH
eukprot:scaffold1352_cov144-Cylindrotheca_fusiformis.AAC.7